MGNSSKCAVKKIEKQLTSYSKKKLFKENKFFIYFIFLYFSAIKLCIQQSTAAVDHDRKQQSALMTAICMPKRNQHITIMLKMYSISQCDYINNSFNFIIIFFRLIVVCVFFCDVC